MNGTLWRILHDLIARWDGPLHFRIIVQPLMATVFAVRDGLRDERKGEPAYFWALFTDAQLRGARIRNGWRSIGRVFFLAVALDLIYQIIAFRWFYPMETLMVAVILALFPYALVRGIAERVKHAIRRLGSTPRSGTVSGGDKRPGTSQIR